MIILDDLDPIEIMSKEIARSLTMEIDFQISRSLTGLAQVQPMTSKYPVRWTTKDGRVLDIEEMGNGHLVNAIRFVEKKSWAIMERPELLGSEHDFSQTRVEHAVMEKFLEENHLHMLDTYPHYRYMCQEAMDRRLEISKL